MPKLEIATASTVAMFAPQIPRSELIKSLAAFEVPGGQHELKPELVNAYLAECDLAVQRLQRDFHGFSQTIRAEAGHALSEYTRDQLRLGCEFVVEAEEFAGAFELLTHPERTALLETWLEETAQEFVTRHLPSRLFEEISSSLEMIREDGSAADRTG